MLVDIIRIDIDIYIPYVYIYMIYIMLLIVVTYVYGDNFSTFFYNRFGTHTLKNKLVLDSRGFFVIRSGMLGWVEYRVV